MTKKKTIGIVAILRKDGTLWFFPERAASRVSDFSKHGLIIGTFPTEHYIDLNGIVLCLSDRRLCSWYEEMKLLSCEFIDIGVTCELM